MTNVRKQSFIKNITSIQSQLPNFIYTKKMKPKNKYEFFDNYIFNLINISKSCTINTYKNKCVEPLLQYIDIIKSLELAKTNNISDLSIKFIAIMCFFDESNIIKPFYENLSEIIPNEKLLLILFNYVWIFDSNFIIKIINKTKVTSEHFNVLVTNTYNIDISPILNSLMSYYLYPTNDELIKIILNGNIINDRIFLRINIGYYHPLYIIYKIIQGLFDQNDTNKLNFKFTDNEKNYLKIAIFSNNFYNRKDIEFMQKYFNFEYDDKCLELLCLNNGQFSVFELLIQKNLNINIINLIKYSKNFCSSNQGLKILDHVEKKLIT